MWMPTHVVVTVQKVSGLIIKGKNNTNDCFVTIALGKTKYQTSIKEKASSAIEWHEECELPIPDQGNTAEIVLTALHRNFLGVDEFLGRAVIPLNEIDVYERPKNRTYLLQSKQGHESKNKERGKLEVKIAFTVKSGSLNDLNKKEKHRSSIGQLSHMAHSVGGSLLSIGSIEKRKGIKKFAKSIGSKMHLKGKKKDGESDDNSSIGSVGSLKNRNHFDPVLKSRQTVEDADPGVVSEDDDEFTFDDLSHKSSGSSLNQVSNQTPANQAVESMENLAGGEVLRRSTVAAIPPLKPPRSDQKLDEWEMKLYGLHSKNNLKPNDPINRRPWESPKLSSRIEEEEPIESQPEQTKDELISNKSNNISEPTKHPDKGMFSKLKQLMKEKSDAIDLKHEKHVNSSERIIIGGENDSRTHNRVSNELLQKFEGKSREDLILLATDLQSDVDHYKKKLKDLEDYLDELLVKVMETTPRLLQNPYATCKLAHAKLSG